MIDVGVVNTFKKDYISIEGRGYEEDFWLTFEEAEEVCFKIGAILQDRIIEKENTNE